MHLDTDLAAATNKVQIFSGDGKLNPGGRKPYLAPRWRCQKTQIRNTSAVSGKAITGKYQKQGATESWVAVVVKKMVLKIDWCVRY